MFISFDWILKIKHGTYKDPTINLLWWYWSYRCECSKIDFRHFFLCVWFDGIFLCLISFLWNDMLTFHSDCTYQEPNSVILRGMKWILWILFFNISFFDLALYYHTDTQHRRCIIRCRSIISRSDDGIKIESDWQIPFFVQLMTKNWVCHSWKNRSWIDCHKFGSTLESYECKDECILF